MAYLDNGGVSHLWKRIRNAISHGAPAHNLLDNSDFMNPVNQRGGTSYAEAGYTIDRWKNGYTAALNITSGGIHLSCTSDKQWLVQYLSDEAWNTLKGKAFTIAACTDDGSVYVCTGTMPAGSDSYDSSQIRIGSSGYLVNLYKPDNDRPIARIFSRDQGSEVTLRWAALYEGTYTSDTLPPYVPKGYAAELAECQRYYRRIISSVFVIAPNIQSTKYWGSGLHFGDMRKPPATKFIENESGRIGVVQGVGYITSGASDIFITVSNGNVLDVYTTNENYAGRQLAFFDIELNADL